MNYTYTISDTHLGHGNILEFQAHTRPGFADIDEHDRYIIQMCQETVRPTKDTLIHCGDVALHGPKVLMFREVKAVKKILILGNHDTFDLALYQEAFDKIYGIWEKKHRVFTHAPIHPDQLRERWVANIHGHDHFNKSVSPKHFNANVDIIGMRPIKVEDLVNGGH